MVAMLDFDTFVDEKAIRLIIIMWKFITLKTYS